jgi:hypothetical protein
VVGSTAEGGVAAFAGEKITKADRLFVSFLFNARTSPLFCAFCTSLSREIANAAPVATSDHKQNLVFPLS